MKAVVCPHLPRSAWHRTQRGRRRASTRIQRAARPRGSSGFALLARLGSAAAQPGPRCARASRSAAAGPGDSETWSPGPVRVSDGAVDEVAPSTIGPRRASHYAHRRPAALLLAYSRCGPLERLRSTDVRPPRPPAPRQAGRVGQRSTSATTGLQPRRRGAVPSARLPPATW